MALVDYKLTKVVVSYVNDEGQLCTRVAIVEKASVLKILRVVDDLDQ